MASLASLIMSLPSTMTLTAIQLGLSTLVIGFTEPHSWFRPAVFPLLCSCTYGIVTRAPQEMRTRWCGLVGGIVYIYLLQYIDVALLSRWSYETHSDHPSSTKKVESVDTKTTKTQARRYVNGITTVSAKSHLTNRPAPPIDSGFLSRLIFGWSSMVSFRHTNTPYEVRGVPPFSRSDPTYTPSRLYFVAHQTLIALVCYSTLDALNQAPPPTNPEEIFAPSRVPVFRRFDEITSDQWMLRVFSTFGFAATFFSIIQLFYSSVGVIGVSLGLSDVASWKPVFGSLSQAYTLRNFWGKFWHQCLRQIITSPAHWLAQNVLKINSKSSVTSFVILIVAFLGSAIMHLVANIAGGGYDPAMLGVFHFFVTQVCGIVFEDRVRVLYHRLSGSGNGQVQGRKQGAEPLWLGILTRGFGYLWVGTFMIWSVPVWVYPGASKPVAVGPRDMVPFSILKAIRQ